MPDYTGSGIWLIEIIDKKPYVILFGHINSQNVIEYDDLGGIIDKNENVVESACREAREESCNLININPKELNDNVAHTITIRSYLSHVIIINQITLSDFYHNVKIVHDKCKNHCWKEKTHITRIPLQNLLENNTSDVNNINGETVFVRNRVNGIINNGKDFFENIHKYIHKKITLYKHIVNHSNIKYLINTFSYMIHEKYNHITREHKHEYAIFLIPNKQVENCENMYIEFVGFSHKHPPLNKLIKSLSTKFRIWKLNKNKIYTVKNKLYFKSNTLNMSANILAKQSFRLIKGPIYSSRDYQVKYPCDIKLLKNIEWDYAIIQKMHNGEYKIINTYNVTEHY